MRVLVTGGAGYIGSVVAEELVAQKFEKVVVLDNLSKGHAPAVHSPAILERGDISDGEFVERICKAHRIESVVHMAAWSLAGESVTDPAKYYGNNVIGGIRLLDALVKSGVRKFVLSSTAAVYGEPEALPITEEANKLPTNPYGETKLALERVLKWYEVAYGMKFVALRYFNAAGATEKNGEQHDPESHIIPIVLDVARGRRASVQVYGSDYPTKDGTCIRDYIHVSDLARAHVLALSHLGSLSDRAFNLGCGGGFSVKEVIDIAREVTGKPIAVTAAPRRAGDPAVLVASSDRIRDALGWRPQKDLRAIISDAWSWLNAHPNGY